MKVIFASKGIAVSAVLLALCTLWGPRVVAQKATPSPTMSREEVLKQIEEAKAQNKKAEAENDLITKFAAAQQAKDWAQAESLLKQLITVDPARWEFPKALAEAQSNQGHYQDAIDSCVRAIGVAQAALADPKADANKIKTAIGQIYTTEGNMYLKLQKSKEAVDVYTKAAELSPNPGTAYFNICATAYNAGNTDAALAACDKALAADPNKPDALFIKGSILFGNGKLDAKGKYLPAPGAVDALNKYLELAPTGNHAEDVKAMLDAAGEKIDTTFKNRKK